VREFLVDAVPKFQRVSGVSLEGVSEVREAVQGVAGREARVR
jgi:hypothetical protein